MKTRPLFLTVCLLAVFASAQPGTHHTDDPVAEKRYVTAVTPGDPSPFMIDTENGDLWKLDLPASEWVFLGTPRGSDSGRKGKFKLIPFSSGEILILDTEDGEIWWTNGTDWKAIKKPSTVRRRSQNSSRAEDL